MPFPSALGPSCVGLRVVVRHRLPGITGPSGGPAMTDVLGVLESWEAASLAVRREDGTLVVVAHDQVVTGKPVPPRPSMRFRVSPEEAERRAAAGWPAVESVRLGEWLLRAAGGYTGRANSALAAGDPGMPLPEAIAAVRDFYVSRGLPPVLQVVAGSSLDAALVRRGCSPARPHQADVTFLLGGVGRAVRLARSHTPSRRVGASGGAPSRRVGASGGVVHLSDELPEGWFATDASAAAVPDVARAVLTARGPDTPDAVRFAAVRQGGMLVARGRLAVTGAGDPWAGVHAMWVEPAHRRRGLGLAVLQALLEEAAAGGASTAYLQVVGDNVPALRLYESLGFTAHHRYRYLRLPEV